MKNGTTPRLIEKQQNKINPVFGKLEKVYTQNSRPQLWTTASRAARCMWTHVHWTAPDTIVVGAEPTYGYDTQHREKEERKKKKKTQIVKAGMTLKKQWNERTSNAQDLKISRGRGREAKRLPEWDWDFLGQKKSIFFLLFTVFRALYSFFELSCAALLCFQRVGFLDGFGFWEEARDGVSASSLVAAIHSKPTNAHLSCK